MCVHTEVYGGGVHVYPYRGVWWRCLCTESDQETDLTYRLYSLSTFQNNMAAGHRLCWNRYLSFSVVRWSGRRHQSTESVRIGCSSGFWGDTAAAGTAR